MSESRAEHDEIAINGRLRVETIDDEVQFWSEHDGWVATVGHKIRGDGLTEAEAVRMAELWNDQKSIAKLERALHAHCPTAAGKSSDVCTICFSKPDWWWTRGEGGA